MLLSLQIKRWEDTDPEDRASNFIPKKFDCLRKVPAYSNYIQERFERCLDLYLCPRQRRIRVSVNFMTILHVLASRNEEMLEMKIVLFLFISDLISEKQA